MYWLVSLLNGKILHLILPMTTKQLHVTDSANSEKYVPEVKHYCPWLTPWTVVFHFEYHLSIVLFSSV